MTLSCLCDVHSNLLWWFRLAWATTNKLHPADSTKCRAEDTNLKYSALRTMLIHGWTYHDFPCLQLSTSSPVMISSYCLASFNPLLDIVLSLVFPYTPILGYLEPMYFQMSFNIVQPFFLWPSHTPYCLSRYPGSPILICFCNMSYPLLFWSCYSLDNVIIIIFVCRRISSFLILGLKLISNILLSMAIFVFFSLFALFLLTWLLFLGHT